MQHRVPGFTARESIVRHRRRLYACVEFVTFTDGPDGMPAYKDTMQYAILRREWDAAGRARAAAQVA